MFLIRSLYKIKENSEERFKIKGTGPCSAAPLYKEVSHGLAISTASIQEVLLRGNRVIIYTAL